jgi:uncharacterized protein
LTIVEQQGEYLIPAPQSVVWAALNDPEVLARCIPGCQTMVREDDSHFSAKVKARVGPVSATFDVGLELQDVAAPDSYRITGNVKGGPAGFGKGGATVRLEAKGAASTRLTYDIDASIGGKLAQVGSRLIDAATRKMADEFFTAFSAQIGVPDPVNARNEDAGGQVVAGGADVATASVQGTSRYETGGQWKVWAVVIVIFVLAMVLSI